MKPLAIDLFCGLGGWTEGLLAENYFVVGFDNERHVYGEAKYPGQLVIQDVLTLHGSQFKNATLIVASPPCQEFSYMAMPWSRGKQIRRALLGEDEFPSGYKGSRTKAELTALFDACFRIQREAIEAAGHFIPLVVENVKGAQPWVGRSRWNYGSFHLFGDVPALMPMTKAVRMKSAISCAPRRWDERIASTPEEAHSLHYRLPDDGQKVPGFRFDGSGKPFQTASVEGVKQHKSGRAWFADPDSISGSTSSKSKARKAASAMIAKIPEVLSRHIARSYLPSFPLTR